MTACIVEVKPLRYTPAGIPAFDFSLDHESEVSEAGGRRSVKATLRAVALGPLAESLAICSIGSGGEFTGFLAGRRNSKSLVFHVQQFKPD